MMSSFARKNSSFFKARNPLRWPKATRRLMGTRNGHGIRGPTGDRTIMKTLLLLVLSMVAVARESTAQDAQCDRERAAMVETIRAYGRSGAGVLGQQGLSERVLEAMGQTKRHLF